MTQASGSGRNGVTLLRDTCPQHGRTLVEPQPGAAQGAASRRIRGETTLSASRLKLWPPLPPDVYVRRPSTELPFPLATDACSLFARGRHALWQGIRALGLGEGDEVLVPAYHCGSE